IALRNNIELQIQHLTTEQRGYDAVGSWGAFDPVISATGSAHKSESEQQSALSGASVVKENDLGLQTGLAVPFHSRGTLTVDYSHLNAETNSSFAALDVSNTDVVTLALTQPLLRGAWSRYATSAQRLSELALERQRESEREARATLLLSMYFAYWDLVSAQ